MFIHMYVYPFMCAYCPLRVSCLFHRFIRHKQCQLQFPEHVISMCFVVHVAMCNNNTMFDVLVVLEVYDFFITCFVF